MKTFPLYFSRKINENQNVNTPGTKSINFDYYDTKEDKKTLPIKLK